MGSFNNVDTAFTAVLSELLERPVISSRNGPMREIVGYSLVLNNKITQIVTNKRRKLDPRYAAAEFLWYLSGDASGEMLLTYAPQYEQFLDVNKMAWGSYGYRMFTREGNILGMIVKELHDNPDSRRAVMPIFDTGDVQEMYQRGCKDMPCTISLQFLLRDTKLHMITTMRSNDVWLGFPYDVFAFTTLHKIIAGTFGVPAGLYYHNVGSMHLYEKNVAAAREALTTHECSTNYDEYYNYTVTLKDTQWALALEESHRRGTKIPVDEEEIRQLPQPFYDLVKLCVGMRPHDERLQYLYDLRKDET